ncbi:MAG: hypothetical protein ACD_79C01331G0003, partial [uncultured bacterium]
MSAKNAPARCRTNNNENLIVRVSPWQKNKISRTLEMTDNKYNLDTRN